MSRADDIDPSPRCRISEPAPSPEYRYLQLKHEKRAYEKQQEELEIAYNDAADQSAEQAQTIVALEVRVCAFSQCIAHEAGIYMYRSVLTYVTQVLPLRGFQRRVTSGC